LWVGERPRALILTSRTGGGHVSLAEALRDRLAARFDVEIDDPQPTLFHAHYRLVSRYVLGLWAAEFRALNTPWRALQAHRVFTRLVSRRLGELLDRVRPDVVLTTYPFLSSEALRVLEQRAAAAEPGTPRIPFVMLFTDPLDLHATWLSERGADATFAPTRETEREALSAGFDRARLHLTGWPVRAQFYGAQQTPRAETLAPLGLDPKRFTVFLQGGGEGAARFALTVENALAVGPRVQVVLACGTNANLFARFSAVPRVAALPFTARIAPYMAAADLVMGKAGPNTLFEAVTLGKPFIATAYIPGQEAANLRFIRQHGLGWVALRPDEQFSLLASLAETPSLLAAMAASVDTYRAWNTGTVERILPLVEGLATQSESNRRDHAEHRADAEKPETDANDAGTPVANE
jgi:UDP-N-acetylglucosamine:LPS N-acetylglucosamine transferase